MTLEKTQGPENTGFSKFRPFWTMETKVLRIYSSVNKGPSGNIGPWKHGGWNIGLFEKEDPRHRWNIEFWECNNWEI